MGKALTPEEVAAEGLPKQAKVISAQEAAAEGLPAPAARGQTFFKETDPGVLPTMGHQFLQGFAKEGGDEIVGAISAGIPKSMGQDREGWDAYRRGRELERQKLATMRQHYPKLSFVMNTLGDMSSDAVAALGGANVLDSKYQTAAGALRGLNASEAELTPDRVTPGDVANAGASTLFGAGVGYGASKLPGAPAAARRGLAKLAGKVESTAVGGRIADSQLAKWFEDAAEAAGKKITDSASGAAKVVAEKIGPIIRAPAEALENFAARRALKSAGYIQKDLKPILVNESADALHQRGKDLLDNGVVKFFDTAADVAERAAAKKAEAGAGVKAALEKAGSGGVPFDMRPFVARARSEILEPLQHDPALKPELAKIATLLDEYAEAANKPGGNTFADANQMKSNLQKSINWNTTSENAQVLVKRLQNLFKDEIDTQVGAAAGLTTKAGLKEARRLYGSMKASAKAANEGTARNAGNRFFGMGVTEGLGTAGPLYLASQGQYGKAAGAAGAALGAKLMKERGPSSVAVMSRGLADAYLYAVENAPHLFGEFGAVLAREKTPEARLAMTEALAGTYPQFADMLEQFKQRLSSSEPARNRNPEVSRVP